MTFIYPYKVGSKSVRKLRDALGARVIKLTNSRFRDRGDTIINWGNSSTPSWATEDTQFLNRPESVYVAVDKLLTLELLNESGVPTVPFTTSPDVAQEWLTQGSKVFARHSLNGHSGDGIEVLKPTVSTNFNSVRQALRDVTPTGEEDAEFISDFLFMIDERSVLEHGDVPPAPLYTRGLQNNGEYRVHVFGGDVILYQKKSRRVDDEGNVIEAEGIDADIRNLNSNWIYRTGNLIRLERVEQLAISAIDTLRLDFGAVDIIMDENGNVYVLEINSAPGISNSETERAYIDAFNR